MPDASAKATNRILGIGWPWRSWLESHLMREKARHYVNYVQFS